MADVALALFAHPDDAEILCAGTLARLAGERSWTIAIASMTPGDCGSAEHSSADISRIRQAEAAASAKRIGAAYHCLGQRDLCLFYDEPTVAKVTRLLREVRPRLVFTHSPDDYLLDHEVTSVVVRAACFAAPVPLFLPGAGEPLEHIPYLYYADPIEGKDALGRPVPATLHVDISSTIERKTEMLACHASQRDWLRRHHGIDQYLIAMREWSARRGAEVGVAFAEGFRQHLGHGYPQSDLLGETLPSFAR